MRMTASLGAALGLSGVLALSAVAAGPLRIETISNDPGRVSGGDVLVKVQAPEDVPLNAIAITRNGEAVTREFHAEPKEHALVGLVTGLREGHNTLSAGARGVGAAEITVTNHPAQGPIFSGPHQQPFICGTAEFKLPDGRLLGPAKDHNCAADTVVTYVYRSRTDQTMKPLPAVKKLPPDADVTTTSTGAKVPYVVRVETGTINRAIYQFAVLHNPISEREPAPWNTPAAWNRRLLYTFGGGCTGGWYRQGSTLADISKGDMVAKGYVEAVATLNVFGINCQDLTAAETMMMVKERVVEALGEPAFTFGRGGSGGSYQQLQIADNYPGLLDGIIPSATFPDVLETTQFLVDIQLLDRYFRKEGAGMNDQQKQAISGVGNLKTIAGTAASAGRINASAFCPKELPVEQRYHPERNPHGTRCDIFDHTVNVYGRDPATGFARRAIDNTGVQYGLQALKDRKLSVDEFLNLNEKIGGYDNDGNMVPQRSAGNLDAIRAAYQTGRMTYGGNGLARVPIIDVRSYLDMRRGGDVHLKYHTFALHERLRAANGSTANKVILVAPESGAIPEQVTAFAIAKMDEWLTTLYPQGVRANPERDRLTISQIEAAKPKDLVDACTAPNGEYIVETQVFSGGRCNQHFPTYPAPRMLAGGPAANNVLKCQLRTPDWNEYGVPFSRQQRERMQKIFPQGVCDWKLPGVEQQKPVGTWLRF